MDQAGGGGEDRASATGDEKAVTSDEGDLVFVEENVSFCVFNNNHFWG